jgi:hypothetical protein
VHLRPRSDATSRSFCHLLILLSLLTSSFLAHVWPRACGGYSVISVRRFGCRLCHRSCHHFLRFAVSKEWHNQPEQSSETIGQRRLYRDCSFCGVPFNMIQDGAGMRNVVGLIIDYHLSCTSDWVYGLHVRINCTACLLHRL